MKHLPFIPKLFINLVLFGLYFAIGSVIAMVVYGIGGMLFAYAIPKPNNPIYDKIGVVALVVVFVITLIYRKYFYMSLANDEEEVIEMNTKKKKHDFTLD